MWHLTCDIRDMVGVNILSKFKLPSSFGLGGRVIWRSVGKGWLNELQRFLWNSTSYTGSVKYHENAKVPWNHQDFMMSLKKNYIFALFQSIFVSTIIICLTPFPLCKQMSEFAKSPKSSLSVNVHICPNPIIPPSPAQLLTRGSRNNFRGACDLNGKSLFIVSHDCPTNNTWSFLPAQSTP